MGACASKFTVLKNASDAPPPAVKNEVESREVNPYEEVAMKKDDSAAVEDEASRRQSLGHLLTEVKSGEENKCSAESNVTEAKVVNEETEKAPVVDGLEEEILACQNVVTEVETVKLETKEEVETLKTQKSEENKAVEVLETLEVQPDKQVEILAEATKCETAPEAIVTEKIDAASDGEKKETAVKLTEIETPEKKPEVTEEQEKETSEAKKKNEENPIETSEKKPESPEIDKTEQKQAEDTEKEMVEKPAENTKFETSDKVEDKHVLEARTTENCSGDKTSEPASDAGKPQAEEEKTKS